MIENLSSRFFKEIEYNSEPWIKDFIFGQKGISNHAHLSLSGSVGFGVAENIGWIVCQIPITNLSGARILKNFIDSDKLEIWYLRGEQGKGLIKFGKENELFG